MMTVDWPRVDIIVITYDRADELLTTLSALTNHALFHFTHDLEDGDPVIDFSYPNEKIRFLIADDCTPGDYQAKVRLHLLFALLEKNFRVEWVPAETNLGWGGNVNRALKYSDAPYVLQLEDDRVLKKDFDLQAAIALMETKPEIGMLRVGGTAGDHYIYHQMEADISPFLPNYREGMALPGKCGYYLFDIGSPSLWIYSNMPHLKRSTFHSLFYGYYPEGQTLGATEEQFCHCVVDIMRDHPYYPVIAVQPDWVVPWFDHIGKSYQHTALDIERSVK